VSCESYAANAIGSDQRKVLIGRQNGHAECGTQIMHGREARRRVIGDHAKVLRNGRGGDEDSSLAAYEYRLAIWVGGDGRTPLVDVVIWLVDTALVDDEGGCQQVVIVKSPFFVVAYVKGAILAACDAVGDPRVALGSEYGTRRPVVDHPTLNQRQRHHVNAV